MTDTSVDTRALTDTERAAQMIEAIGELRRLAADAEPLVKVLSETQDALRAIETEHELQRQRLRALTLGFAGLDFSSFAEGWQR